MKKSYIILSIALSLSVMSGCNEDEFLNKQPKGSLSGDQLLDPAGAESLVTAAYAALPLNFPEIGPAFFSPLSNWSFGDVRSDDAYKGGGGTGDISEYHNLEISNITADNGTLNNKWRALYYAIARTNSALKALNNIDQADYPEVKQRIAEVK